MATTSDENRHIPEYNTKPKPVKALQFTDEVSAYLIIDWVLQLRMGAKPFPKSYGRAVRSVYTLLKDGENIEQQTLSIEDPQTFEPLNLGDWLVLNENGAFSRVPNSQFEELFELKQ